MSELSQAPKARKLSPFEFENAEIAEASERFRDFQVTEEISRSWSLYAENLDGSRNSMLAYHVTWTPGTIVLDGDLGCLVVTHHNALSTLIGGCNWLKRSNFQYLMEKSDACIGFSATATIDKIIEIANEAALPSMREERDRRRDYRNDDVSYRDWHVTSGAGIETYEPDTDESLLRLRCDENLEMAKVTPAWSVPEGWHLWFKIWLQHGCHNGVGPNEIFSGAGRRKLKKRLLAEFRVHGKFSALSFFNNLGMTDFYGVMEYAPIEYFRYAALQRWARHVLIQEPN